MRKSLKSTLILGIVFLALVAWYQIYEKRMKPKQNEAEDKTKELVSLSKDDVQELEIEKLKSPPPDDAPPGTAPASTETQKIKLKLTGKDWNLAEPVQDAADNTAVTSMITTLTTTRYERLVEEAPKDLQAFGLQTPLIKITARKGGAEKGQVVKVGSNTPTGFSSYVQFGDSPKVYRVARTIRSTFDKDVKSVRNKSILDWNRGDIGEVEVQNSKENYIVKKEAGDKEEWFLARDGIPADATEWNKILNGVLEVKATDFPSEDAKNLGAFGLTKSRARVLLVKAKEKTKLAIQFGKVGEKVYAKRDDRATVYEVDKEVLNKLEAPSTGLRSLRLANFNRFDVKRIKLERGADVVELLKDGQNWSFPTDPAAKVNTAKVDTLLAGLQDTKLTRYLAANTPGVSAPQLVIRLFEKKEKDETERLSLKFGKAQGKLIPTERSALDIPFLINEEDFKKMNLGQKDFIQADEKKEETKTEAKKS